MSLGSLLTLLLGLRRSVIGLLGSDLLGLLGESADLGGGDMATASTRPLTGDLYTMMPLRARCNSSCEEAEVRALLQSYARQVFSCHPLS